MIDGETDGLKLSKDERDRWISWKRDRQKETNGHKSLTLLKIKRSMDRYTYTCNYR